MGSKEMTKAQLEDALVEMQQQVAKLEALEAECRRMEKALRRSEQNCRTLLDNAGDAIFIHDLEGQILEVNQVACERLGYSREELLQMTPMDFDAPEYAALFPRRIEELQRHGHIIAETAHVRRDGTLIPIELSSRLVEYEGKNVVLSIARDVTERKQTEEALRGGEERLRTLFASMHDLVFVIDREGRFTEFYQPAHSSRLYIPPKQFLGQRFDAVLPPDVAEDLAAAIEGVDETDQVRSFDYLLEIEGQGRWFSANVNAVRDRMGETDSYIGVVRDITERKQVEEALRGSEEMAQALLNAPTDVALLMDPDGIVVALNKAAEVSLGGSPDELVGRRVFDLFPPDVAEYRRDRVSEVVSSGKPVRFEDYREGRWFDQNVYPVLDAHGKVARVAVFGRDVTERRRAEETLRRYAVELEARNAELDAFAHTVAHDLKGSLGVVVGYAEVLEESYASLPRQELREHLRTLAQNGRKMSRIIDELLLLAEVRKAEVEIGHLDMGTILAEVQRRLHDLVEGSGAEVVLPATWPRAVGYGPWIEEVWVNYLSNALKYGGRPPRVELGAEVHPDGFARFWIRDNGPGLTVEEQARLFAPFTRLDQVRVEGHGLGLSIVRRIVEKLGGQVGVEGEVGAGSTFWFTLPLA
jgi:PAS domain S-box-containing protein